MNIEQAKDVIKHAIESYEGEGWNDEGLQELMQFIEQQEKELNRAHRDARDSADRARI